LRKQANPSFSAVTSEAAILQPNDARAHLAADDDHEFYHDDMDGDDFSEAVAPHNHNEKGTAKG